MMRFLLETFKTLFIALLIVVPLRLYVAQPFFVRGSSMEPTYSNGDYLIIDEFSYRFSAPQRGDVIVFRYPADPSQFFIKRVIGLPGETVIGEKGSIFVERAGERLQIEEPYAKGLAADVFEPIDAGPNQYIVLGDNRSASSDSRRWGVLPREKIVGKVLLTVWPVQDFALASAPDYEF